MQFLKDIFSLFFPKLCAGCKKPLLQNEKVICTICRHDLPVICYTDFNKNDISTLFYGRVSIEKVNSFFLFEKEGIVKELIHELKYSGNQEIGSFIGNWFGRLLSDSGEFEDIDYIVPVPLHKKKQQQRGYNQLTKFSESLGNILLKEVKPGILLRVSPGKTQTSKNRLERFLNTKTVFHLDDLNIFENKHILLVDDVITTGATLVACSLELQKTKNIKISILTMAFAA